MSTDTWPVITTVDPTRVHPGELDTIIDSLVARIHALAERHLAVMLLTTDPDKAHLVRRVTCDDDEPYPYMRTWQTHDPCSITVEADPPVTACDWPVRPVSDQGEHDATDALIRIACDLLAN